MKYDFNKASRIISVDCFPVDKLWLVYSEGPKKFKTKVHAIAACFLSDDMNSLVFRAITTMDIDAGFVLDLNEGLDNSSNYIGILDEADNWIELTASEIEKIRLK